MSSSQVLGFLRFLLVEAIAKSIALCLVVTFAVYLLLCITPRVERHGVSSHDTWETQQGNRSDGSISYWEWLWGLAKGDLGRIKSGQSVYEEVKNRVLVTFLLSFISLVPAAFVSLILGLFSCKRSVRIGGAVISLLTSLPAFLLGYFLYGVFGGEATPVTNLLAAILTLGLSCGVINEMSRIIDNAVKDEKTKDYMETARAKGLEESPYPGLGRTGFHSFRNALITIVPRLCALYSLTVSGSIVVEQVFRLDGLSNMLLGGLGDADTPRVLTVVLLAVLLVRVGSVLTDFLYFLLNPRYGQR